MLLHTGSSQDTDPILHIGKTQFQDANFPMDDQGRTYHLGTKVFSCPLSSWETCVWHLLAHEAFKLSS